MSKNINLDLKTIVPQLRKHSRRFLKHAPFVAITLVLLVYVLIIARISSLTTAEPTPEAESAALAKTNIPKIDKEAVAQIESLEKSSEEIKSLFNAARSNPFLE